MAELESKSDSGHSPSHPNGNPGEPPVVQGNTGSFPVFGDVFSWGTFSDGDIEAVPAAQGHRITSLSGNVLGSGVVCTTPDAPSRLQWLVHGKESKDHEDSPAPLGDAADTTSAVRVAMGDQHRVTVAEDGSLFSWGDNSVGQLGFGNVAPVLDPELVQHLEQQVIVGAACGEAHTCIVASNGDVYTCGRAREGQLGLAYKSSKARATAGVSTLFQPVPKFVAALLNHPVSAIACGPRFTVAVTRAGEVYAWGEGGCGQLGIGRVTVQDRPEQVMACDPDDGSPFEEVACGLAHVLARSANGNVWVWGLNVKGQLGLGDTTSRFTPTLLEEQDLSKSTDHAAKAKAATEIGSASGVAFRQLGSARERAPVPSLDSAGGGKEDDGESKRAPLGKRPQTPLDIEAASQLKAAEHVSPAAYLAASNSLDQSLAGLALEELPPAVQTSVAVPAPEAVWGPATPRLRAVSISAGKHHSAAVTPDGQLYTWGSAEGGRLGHPDRTYTVFNGDIETTLMVNTTYPKRVQALADRRATAVQCSGDATAVVVASEFERMHPINGYTSGNTTVSFYGVGLSSIASAGGVTLAPGTPIPGVMVRFTRHRRDPSVHEDEDEEDASLDSEYLRELEELVAYAPAFAPAAGSDAAMQCKTPAFPSPCDVEVQLIVDDSLLIRGSMVYSFYDPPKLHSVAPELVKLGGGDEVFIDGDGLFGCMLADPGWKDVAKGFMAKVEALQAEEERAKANGKGKKKQKKKTGDDESEPLSATLEEPSPLSKLTVRFEMYCDGEPVPDSKPSLVPGRYVARMVPGDPDDAFDESPFGDDDPVEDDGGEFSASVAARMPAIAIPAAIMQRMRDGEDLRMEFMVQIAISGDDFIPGRLVSAFAAGVVASFPPEAPVVGGTTVTLNGYGFIDAPSLMVRLRTVNPPKEWLVRPKFENNGTLSFITPELKLPFREGTPLLDASGTAVACGAGGGAGAGASVDGQSVAASAAGAGPEAGAEAALDAGGSGGDATERSTYDAKQPEADGAAAATTDEPVDASADAAGNDGAAAADADGVAAASVNGETTGAEHDATDAGTASVVPSVAPSVDDVLPSARSVAKPQPSAPTTKASKKQAEVVHPTFGSGKVFIDVAVRDGDFFETPAALLAYAGDLSTASTDIGPMAGGTTVTLRPSPEQEGWVFPSSRLLVKVSNDDFQFILPGVLADGCISVTMPPLPSPPADEGGDGTEDSKASAAGEGDAQGDTAGGDDEEASGLGVDGVRRPSVLADDDAVAAAVGVARADVIDQVQVLAAPSPNVTLSVTLDGFAWLNTSFPFQYYDLAGCALQDATPSQVTVGDEVMLHGCGWKCGSTRPTLVRVRTEEEGEKVAEGSPTRLLAEDSGDPDDADAVWVLTFPMPVLSLPPAEGDGEEEDAGKKKKKGKAKVKVRPVWFDVSVDGGQNWFSTANDEDVHIQVKDPLP